MPKKKTKVVKDFFVSCDLTGFFFLQVFFFLVTWSVNSSCGIICYKCNIEFLVCLKQL